MAYQLNLPHIKTRILFVCLGNICRSPLAEGIFLDIIENDKTSHLFEVDSAGTSNFHIGELPDYRTRKNAKINGLELVHRGRQFIREDFYTYDYIIPMDDSNLRDILDIKPKEELSVEIVKMRFYDPLLQNSNVPDPWFGDEKGFEDVYQILKRSCLNFYESLQLKKS